MSAILAILATVALSAPGVLSNNDTQPPTLDAVDGTCLMQSGGSITMLSAGQLVDDVFADLEDEFDVQQVGVETLLTDETGDEDSVDAAYWARFCLDIAILAVVADGIRRWRAGRKGRKDASRLASIDRPAQVTVADAAPAKPADFGELAQAVQASSSAAWRNMLVEIPDIVFREDACGCTALHVAAQWNSVDLAQELLERGADANSKDFWDETPLHIAARAGSVDVCKVLLTHGAVINAMDASDRTPVLTAAYAEQEKTCELLLDNGGGCAHLSDSSLPPFLSRLFVARMASAFSGR